MRRKKCKKKVKRLKNLQGETTKNQKRLSEITQCKSIKNENEKVFITFIWFFSCLTNSLAKLKVKV
jgi:hypothetical protein